eukprot:gb/GECH01008991.1/.p1 GENE.gb/GECH01008991.1/~~gb/GECH01008991.1/.p1  ORF type:complete len:189 (+),score=29.47 gb/GECH01008991.1/:1-567(+)
MSSKFYITLTGQIDYAEFPGNIEIYSTFSFEYGKDWEVVRPTGERANLEMGSTQVAARAPGSLPHFIWNFPLEITFASTNPYGWPKIVVCLYQSKGKNSVRLGYGWTQIPVFPGRREIKIPLFKPVSSSTIQNIIGSIIGSPPEFDDPAFVSKGKDREVTRVQSEGYIIVNFEVLTKNMFQFGYEDSQ